MIFDDKVSRLQKKPIKTKEESPLQVFLDTEQQTPLSFRNSTSLPISCQVNTNISHAVDPSHTARRRATPPPRGGTAILFMTSSDSSHDVPSDR